jgi:hypothetical protein
MPKAATPNVQKQPKKKSVATAAPQPALDPMDALTAQTPAGIPKNFRQQADIESFFRFVYENDLRLEALEILDSTREMKKAAKTAKAKVKH